MKVMNSIFLIVSFCSVFLISNLALAADSCEPFLFEARGFNVHLEPGQTKTYCIDTISNPINLTALSITAKQPFTNWYGNVIKNRNFDLSMKNVTNGLEAYHQTNYYSVFVVNGLFSGIPLSHSIIEITVKLSPAASKPLDVALTYSAATN